MFHIVPKILFSFIQTTRVWILGIFIVHEKVIWSYYEYGHSNACIVIWPPWYNFIRFEIIMLKPEVRVPVFTWDYILKR